MCSLSVAEMSVAEMSTHNAIINRTPTKAKTPPLRCGGVFCKKLKIMSQYCTEVNGKWKNNESGKLYDDMAPCILEGVSKEDMIDEYNSTVDDIKDYLSVPKSDFFKKYGLFLLVIIVLVIVYFMFFKK